MGKIRTVKTRHYVYKSHYIYALFCQDGDSPIYVKIGRTGNPFKRLLNISTACPIPAQYIALAECSGLHNSEKAEKALHERFRDRNTNGEWFRFDHQSAEDKNEFHNGSREVFSRIFSYPRPLEWKKMSLYDLKKAQMEFRAREKKPKKSA